MYLNINVGFPSYTVVIQYMYLLMNTFSLPVYGGIFCSIRCVIGTLLLNYFLCIFWLFCLFGIFFV